MDMCFVEQDTQFLPQTIMILWCIVVSLGTAPQLVIRTRHNFCQFEINLSTPTKQSQSFFLISPSIPSPVTPVYKALCRGLPSFSVNLHVREKL